MPNSFATLGLRQELLDALEQLSFVEMTPIQAQALPPILAGSDVVGQAKTGSGKTAAFGLGLLQGIDPTRLQTQALVLCPTRELAEQVATELRRLAKRLPNTRITTTCGGRPIRPQKLALEQGTHIVVGTPGRVGDHLERGTLNVDTLQFLVLDEADRMLDMGFIDEVRAILDQCPFDRQTLLFSATFPEQISQLSARVQRDPVSVTVETQVEASLLRQQVFECEPDQRGSMLLRLLATYQPESALIFCETRASCDELTRLLQSRGASALALHGALDQRERDDVLVQFTNGSVRLLVATNVAARGLDIEALPAVVVAELSPDPESHLHRIGRTGRAGEQGMALSIVTPREKNRLGRIEAFLGQKIERGPVPGINQSVGFLAPVNRTVLILSGRKDKLRKGDVLGALVKDGGLPVDAIGRIDLSDKTCAVAVAQEHAHAALKYLQRARVKNKRVKAILLG